VLVRSAARHGWSHGGRLPQPRTYEVRSHGFFSRQSRVTDTDDAPSAEPSEVETDLWEVLGHFSEALAIVQTVSHALQAAENNGQCPTIGAEIATLRQGIDELIAVHEEFDLAIPEVAS
jgi:hypothetical protein